MKEIKLYSPIEISTYEGESLYPSVINGIPYAEKIAKTLELTDSAAGDRGLMAFFDKTRSPKIDEKVYSIHYALEINEAQLYCVTTIRLSGDVSLNIEEMVRIKDFISGSMSDGIGEVLEQTPIIVEDGEIYAHLWQDSNWNLMSQSEFDKLTSIQKAIHKPDAPMIGANGNLINQLSIAKKALVENGQDYVAKEMVKRAMDSESYDEALRIVSEYVNLVDKHYYIKPKGKNNDFKNR